jgi:hypothetical protein
MLEELFLEKARPSSLGVRIIRVLLTLILCGLFVGIGFSEFNRSSELARRLSIPCRITGSSVNSVGSGFGREKPYHVQIEYEYQALKRTFAQTGDPTGNGTDDASEAYAIASCYPVGKSSVCYMNPQEPGDAVLNRDVSTSGKAILISSLVISFLFIALYCIPQLFFYRHKSGTNAQRNRIVGIVAGLLLFVGFGSILTFWYLMPLCHEFASLRWPAVPATVMEANMIREHEAGEYSFDSYWSDIHYSYVVNGVVYHSNCYNFTETKTLIGTARKAFAETFHPGQQLKCYVDPNSPRSAVLTRHVSPGLFTASWPAAVTLFAFSFLLVGGNEEPLKRFIRSRRYTFSMFAILLFVGFVWGQFASP